MNHSLHHSIARRNEKSAVKTIPSQSRVELLDGDVVTLAIDLKHHLLALLDVDGSRIRNHCGGWLL
jgi:hypothetical protein